MVARACRHTVGQACLSYSGAHRADSYIMDHVGGFTRFI
jgi:hypothetical protein